MASSDNLLDMAEAFMTPDVVQKFSSALGQPAEKILSGLKTVVPAFLMGLVSKGSSPEGAESLVKMARVQGVDSTTVPASVSEANYLQKGVEAVNGIFGNQLNSIATKLAAVSGLSSSSVTKMMNMIAPAMMGILGKKITEEGLSASGLMNFLGQQKSSLLSAVPAGISGLFGGLGAVTGSAKSAFRRSDDSTKRSWLTIAAVAVIALGAIWWFAGRRTAEVTASNTTSAVPELALPAAELEGLGPFLAAGNTSELPKRFSFQKLNFVTGAATLGGGATLELDEIAAAMKARPTATARIEGFTDSTGDAAANRNLSLERAQFVKQELVRRGIDANRIETAGRGADLPVAPNDTAEGRALNRRIEFVVLSL